MAVGDLCELVVVQSIASQTVLNVLGFKDADAVDSISALLNDFDTNFLTTFLSDKKNTVTCSLLKGVDVRPGTAATVLHNVSPAKAGGISTSDALCAPQLARVATLSTLTKGRSFRGRLFLSGYWQTSESGGVWGSANVAATQTIMNSLLTRYGFSGTYAHWVLNVISRRLNHVVRPSPVGTTVNAITVHDTVRSQRRREIGVGV